MISFSVTFTSPGQRQQLVQRWQRYLGGVFMLLYFKEAVLLGEKPLWVGCLVGLAPIEKK